MEPTDRCLSPVPFVSSMSPVHFDISLQFLPKNLDVSTYVAQWKMGSVGILLRAAFTLHSRTSVTKSVAP
jgi:hypothetical protein